MLLDWYYYSCSTCNMLWVESFYGSEMWICVQWHQYRCPETSELWWWHEPSRRYFFEKTGKPILSSTCGNSSTTTTSMWSWFLDPVDKQKWWWNEMPGECFFASTGFGDHGHRSDHNFLESCSRHCSAENATAVWTADSPDSESISIDSDMSRRECDTVRWRLRLHR